MIGVVWNKYEAVRDFAKLIRNTADSLHQCFSLFSVSGARFVVGGPAPANKPSHFILFTDKIFPFTRLYRELLFNDRYFVFVLVPK